MVYKFRSMTTQDNGPEVRQATRERPAGDALRRLPAPHLARRAAAVLQRPAGQHEHRRPAAACGDAQRAVPADHQGLHGAAQGQARHHRLGPGERPSRRDRHDREDARPGRIRPRVPAQLVARASTCGSSPAPSAWCSSIGMPYRRRPPANPGEHRQPQRARSGMELVEGTHRTDRTDPLGARQRPSVAVRLAAARDDDASSDRRVAKHRSPRRAGSGIPAGFARAADDDDSALAARLRRCAIRGTSPIRSTSPRAAPGPDAQADGRAFASVDRFCLLLAMERSLYARHFDLDPARST